MPKQTTKPSSSKPKYPYTTTPAALGKFLQEVPKRPKPTKVDFALLQTWGMKNNNTRTILSVLKDLGLIDGTGTPANHYIDFMRNETGATSLGLRIKEVYSQLFETSLEPHRESYDNLKNFFNIHSGGGEKTIQLQIQTFKTLCEHADFSSTLSQSASSTIGQRKDISAARPSQGDPQIQINLHIHLPENKSRADYEDIIKDIGKYIYGK